MLVSVMCNRSLAENTTISETADRMDRQVDIYIYIYIYLFIYVYIVGYATKNKCYNEQFYQ